MNALAEADDYVDRVMKTAKLMIKNHSSVSEAKDWAEARCAAATSTANVQFWDDVSEVLTRAWRMKP